MSDFHDKESDTQPITNSQLKKSIKEIKKNPQYYSENALANNGEIDSNYSYEKELRKLRKRILEKRRSDSVEQQ